MITLWFRSDSLDYNPDKPDEEPSPRTMALFAGVFFLSALVWIVKAYDAYYDVDAGAGWVALNGAVATAFLIGSAHWLRKLLKVKKLA
ncbi:MAG: hypothetical protein SXU28_10860 [Pseudomonadota bacterium]|nr:hypothetical protein [Pseudomonadota bacterium]